MWTRGHVDTQRISAPTSPPFLPVKLSSAPKDITRGTDKPSHQCRVGLPYTRSRLNAREVITCTLDYLRQIQAWADLSVVVLMPVLEL